MASNEKDLTDAIKAQDEEAMAAAEERKTAGRKGFKLQRLNISLTKNEYDYVRIMSAVSGKSMTRFIGDLISREAERNHEAFDAAREIIKNVK